MIRLFIIRCIVCFSITFISLSATAQNTFELAPPLMKFGTTFFTKEATINLLFAQPGAHIYYTTNGEEPSVTDRVYAKPVVITENLTTLKAKAYAAGFLPSATVSATFVKDGLAFKASFPPADSRYAGEGPTTLNNNQGGIANQDLPHWLGYQQDSVTMSLSLTKETELKSVLLDVMQNQGAWIFFPNKVEAFAFNKQQNKMIKVGETVYHPEKNVDDRSCKPMIIQLNNTLTQELKLVFHNQQLPLWHSGKGNNSWLFIDEIKLY
jgi:hypothetical protein